MSAPNGPRWMAVRLDQIEADVKGLRAITEESRDLSKSNQQTLTEVIKPGLARIDLVVSNLDLDVLKTSKQVERWKGGLTATRLWGSGLMGILAAVEVVLLFMVIR